MPQGNFAENGEIQEEKEQQSNTTAGDATKRNLLHLRIDFPSEGARFGLTFQSIMDELFDNDRTIQLMPKTPNGGNASLEAIGYHGRLPGNDKLPKYFQLTTTGPPGRQRTKVSFVITTEKRDFSEWKMVELVEIMRGYDCWVRENRIRQGDIVTAGLLLRCHPRYAWKDGMPDVLEKAIAHYTEDNTPIEVQKRPKAMEVTERDNLGRLSRKWLRTEVIEIQCASIDRITVQKALLRATDNSKLGIHQFVSYGRNTKNPTIMPDTLRKQKEYVDGTVLIPVSGIPAKVMGSACPYALEYFNIQTMEQETDEGDGMDTDDKPETDQPNVNPNKQYFG